MKNLYRRFGIDPAASIESITEILRNSPISEDRRDASAVLLNENRRRIYDQRLRVLKTIGMIRRLNHLDRTVFWNTSTYTDFASRSEARGRAMDDAAASASGRRSSPAAWKVWSGLLLLVVLTIWAVSEWNDSHAPPPERGDVTTETSDYYQEIPDGRYGDGYSAYDEKQYASVPVEAEFNEPELPLPRTGKIWTTARNRIAPLRVSVPSYGNHYYVKMVKDGMEVLSVFIRSGATVEVEMPLGSYQMRYAFGETWYGTAHLFGPDTRYFIAEDVFRFYEDGNYVQGARVELILQQNGNLETKEISGAYF